MDYEFAEPRDLPELVDIAKKLSAEDLIEKWVDAKTDWRGKRSFYANGSYHFDRAAELKIGMDAAAEVLATYEQEMFDRAVRYRQGIP